MPEPKNAIVLQVPGLSFGYPGQSLLFGGWNADLGPGVTLLEGDTGSGKTTLLRLLAGELRGAGERVLNGRRLGDDAATDRREVCWFNPRDEAFDALTSAGLMAALRERHPALDEAACQRHLAGFGLAPHLAKPLYALSTGSRRKAGLAVALSTGCALTLLDDASAGLDCDSMNYLARALEESADGSRRAVLLVCSPEPEALPLAGRISTRA
jgi:ABC-type multidrug transport system ATPase subunit